MTELNRTTRAPTTPLLDCGAGSSSSSNDQRRRNQDTEEKSLALKLFVSQPSSPPPPACQESELFCNVTPPITEVESALAAARNFGQAISEDLSLIELQDSLSDVRDHHMPGTPSVWHRLRRQLNTLKDKQRNPRWMFVFGMTLALLLLAILIIFLYPRGESPPSDFWDDD